MKSPAHPGRWCPRRTLLAFSTGLSLAVLTALSLPAAATAAPVPSPTVIGPIAASGLPGTAGHDYPYFTTNHDLPEYNYIEEEFFIEGTANRYNTPAYMIGSTTDPTATVIDGGHAYRTRIVVRRPAEKKQFSGTVLVEWYNVTNNFDAENFWFFSWEHIMRSGHVWVGVSAQRVGVNTGTYALKTWSPTRYGSLDVTAGGTINDDSLCYDIYSQAGKVMKNNKNQNGGVDVLGGLKPRTVLAVGESQSAFRLATYANSIQPLANVYDGILALSNVGQPIRPDVAVPYFKFLTEWDIVTGEARIRQPDTAVFRTWEVAGTSHVDQHLRSSREPLELRDNRVSSEAALNCTYPSIGTRTPTHFVLSAAIQHMISWVTTGIAPPTSPRLEIAQFGPPTLAARNSLGIALGGIRLPEVEVPTGLNTSINPGLDTTSGACARWGTYLAFDVSTLNTLYRTHQQYVREVTRVVNRNVRQGHLLEIDARQIVEKAAESHIGGPDQNGQFDSSLDVLNDPTLQ